MRHIAALALWLLILALPVSLSASFWSSEDNLTKKELKKTPIEVRGLKRLEPKELLEVLGAEVHPWYEFWADREPKIATKLIPTIPDTLRGWLDSKGYYDATFKIDKSAKKIVLTIHEGRPVIVRDINISSDFPIEDIVSFKRGEPFETERFIKIKKRIKSALLSKGYCSYDLNTKAYVDLDRHRVSLLYQLKKGGLCRFGKTRIVKKPKDIRDEVILSRMRYRPGDLFTTERIKESYAALNELGLFGRTLIDTQIKYFNEVRPEVSVSKKEKLRRYTIALGYDTELGFRLRGSYDHFNFLGDGRKLGVNGQYSSQQKEISLSFFQPALFTLWGDRYINLESENGYFEKRYDNYTERRFSLDGRLNYADGFWSIDLGLALQRIRINSTDENDQVIAGNFNLGYGYLRMGYDRRDSKSDPRDGYYIGGYLESGYSMGVLEDDPYYLMTLEGHYISSFGSLTLAEVGRLGILDDGGKAALPASKFFYAGGPYSNRAYAERKIGVTDSKYSDSSLGGRSWLNFSIEAKYPLMENIYGGVFFDATMISRDSYDFSSQWIKSAGAGIRYATPIGPLKLDFAVNVHDPSIRHFGVMIGESF